MPRVLLVVVAFAAATTALPHRLRRAKPEKSAADDHAPKPRTPSLAALESFLGGTAAETLVDAAMARCLFRQADAFATRFARHCGPERRVAARLAHGRATITKVVAKRQLALVEKVVRRVDDACGDASEDVEAEGGGG